MDASHVDGGITYTEVELSFEKTFFTTIQQLSCDSLKSPIGNKKKEREMLGLAKKSETSFTSLYKL